MQFAFTNITLKGKIVYSMVYLIQSNVLFFQEAFVWPVCMCRLFVGKIFLIEDSKLLTVLALENVTLNLYTQNRLTFQFFKLAK